MKYVGWVKNFKLTAITAKKGGSNITGSRQFKDVYITGQKLLISEIVVEYMEG